ncbi:MAG: hypothetical protein NT067_01505 [Candidatus Diapherotrites archaeon]|nr:hypothetical protein [Candidatus Diapherotrites archaeon]
MKLKENDEHRNEIIAHLKRNCLLCTARKGIDYRDREKESVLADLAELKKGYEFLYDQYRKENRSGEEIQAMLHNKRVCMDAIEVCQKCERELEKVSRFLSGY